MKKKHNKLIILFDTYEQFKIACEWIVKNYNVEISFSKQQKNRGVIIIEPEICYLGSVCHNNLLKRKTRLRYECIQKGYQIKHILNLTPECSSAIFPSKSKLMDFLM